MPKELILSGRVQGVFCRNYCSQYGKKLSIHGSATNLSNGTVRVLLDCDDEKLKEFVNAIKLNIYNFKFYGHIENITVNEYSGPIRGDYKF